MKIWILGAGGQLGRTLIDYASVKRIRVVASNRADFDVTDLEALEKGAAKIKPTHIINCAAYTNVDGAEKAHREASAVNAKGPENIGIVARDLGINVVHVSTDYVFDGQASNPYKESDKPNPLGVYGKTKLEGEERLIGQVPSACIVRTSWIFGRGGNNFLSSAFERLKKHPKMHADGDQINRATFNRDLACTLIDLSSYSGIFHFANSGPKSRYDLIKDFFDQANERGAQLACQEIIKVGSDHFPSGAKRPLYSALDTEKTSQVLGRKPRVWETVLTEYLDDHIQPKLMPES